MADRPGVWRAMLETQWKSTRGLMLFAALVMFAVPLFSLYTSVGARTDAIFIMTMQSWAVAYTLCAAGLGLLMGMQSWSQDHRLRHVYALSLPIPRWQFVLHRFTIGLLLLVLPMVTLFIGAEIVAHSSLVPQTLTAYPVALTLRFVFATLVAYAVFFSISSATARTAGYILGAVTVVFAGQILLSAIGVRLDLAGRFADLVLASPGLLAVFSGRWMLIDV
ncbi:MAG TPA: hypothetical protein VIP11_18730 [Gemmatimonadaceae bacterium]